MKQQEKVIEYTTFFRKQKLAIERTAAPIISMDNKKQTWSLKKNDKIVKFKGNTIIARSI